MSKRPDYESWEPGAIEAALAEIEQGISEYHPSLDDGMEFLFAWVGESRRTLSNSEK